MIHKKISEVFKVSVKTIYLWRKGREETGNIKPSSGYQFLAFFFIPFLVREKFISCSLV
jgi:hypothetical protein